MIIDAIRITNFGLYKGDHVIDLSPDNLSGRNITVVTGQNGVGKSTLQEAIHLCLLGSLSIDDRVSESNYERYLIKRSYRGSEKTKISSAIELSFEFLKSGAEVRYVVTRSWNNTASDPNEAIDIKENGVSLELSKKEKNLFLRELIQPGLAKVMFFDGEKLLSLYDEAKLSQFISDSCRYLFGLNFVDLLHTDLNYYINKLQAQQDPSQSLAELQKVKEEVKVSDAEIITTLAERSELMQLTRDIKNNALQIEKQISDQGRWAMTTLEKLKAEQRALELEMGVAKKDLVEVYSALGPFVFCRDLCESLKVRLLEERNIEKWQHASDLLVHKVNELESTLKDPVFLQKLSLTSASSETLLTTLKDILLNDPKRDGKAGKIEHEITDSERDRLLGWVDHVLDVASQSIIKKSDILGRNDDRLKILLKEMGSFSKDDVLQPLLNRLQELNKSIGSNEQKIVSLNRRSEEATKRKAFYEGKQKSLEEKMLKDANVDDRLKLSSKTRQVLEDYAQQLLRRKITVLKRTVIEKFNQLCRKESYMETLEIDPNSFEITLKRGDSIVEHAHLSAGEKQLLIISFLWGLRELTNISLPLIIDTPLARLDLEHRKTFIEQFLPAIQPQVILIGTDMELANDVMDRLEPHMAHQYLLSYNSAEHSTVLTPISRSRKELVS